MEAKPKVCSPFILQRGTSRKTSSEIVSEARSSLRVQTTHRPFTPKEGQRQLFGQNSVRAGRDNRPPSTFSLHTQHFDSDSRPGSGTRLLPLDHKPKFPVTFPAEDPCRAIPKPPADLVGVRRQPTGARARLLKTGSLTNLLSINGETNYKSGPGPRLKPLATKQLPSKEDAGFQRAHVKTIPRRTASESRVKQPDVDSGLRSTECRAEQKTELRCTNTDEDAEAKIWSKDILPLLQQLERGGSDHPDPENAVDRLCKLCDDLYGTLSKAELLERRCKHRSAILRALFGLIDLNSAQLNLHIAELCLALCVSGNNLLNICKLIFQISRSENNDALFQNCSIIDMLLEVLCREDVSKCGYALLYCVGTLKFLSGNSTIVKLLLDKNSLGVAEKLLQKLSAVDDSLHTTAGHILVQLTVTLRNLANNSDSRPLFVSHCILPALCMVLRRHCKDQDICTNISRIYSKLSSYSECRLALTQTPDCYQLFLELLSKHHQKQDLVVRLLFTLGNLTSKSDEPRQQLFQCTGCVDILLQIYHSYQQRDGSTHTASPKEADDVLVKLIRVLANMCIHPSVGPHLASNVACVQLLMETLELRSVQESEELLVTVAATINNLSFYQEERSAITANQLTIAQLILKLMLSSNMEALLEATRVYGNLSLSKDVRDFLMQNKVDQFLVTVLDSKSVEMCFYACGVLTNLAMDPPNRVPLLLEGVSGKLLDCLKDLGGGDWQLAGQVCQAMWNLIGCGSEELPDSQESVVFLRILIMYTDEEEALQWMENEHMTDFHRQCWKIEFLPVAQKLMKVLQHPV
ncbi:armadillo repeat-containing protein 2 [Gouania willdenowi]|uniref:Armadillo repeat-containing protein 2 n=1 Tax=Gouania willdenowi TaxID=441366 RepID=A0A8C5GYG2_GOUWI|nr:armadillo repeat-containing protein 2 [Gouania willdenowi]